MTVKDSVSLAVGVAVSVTVRVAESVLVGVVVPVTVIVGESVLVGETVGVMVGVLGAEQSSRPMLMVKPGPAKGGNEGGMGP